jgi:cobalamin synthase
VSLRNTFAHLTAIRVPPRARVPLAHSIHYFPWMAAALGSLNILFFLAASRFLPAFAACLLAVIFPQVMAGFTPWRGVIESVQGVRTLPGYGFLPGFRADLRGVGVVAALLLAKWGALLMLPPDWRVRAVFVFPILGMCARTVAFLLERPSGRDGGAFAARRRVRAGFLTGVLLFLVFLFPARVAFAILVLGAAAVWWTLRTRNRDRKGGPRGLTLQTAGLVSEVAETAVLCGLVLAGLVLFRF